MTGVFSALNIRPFSGCYDLINAVISGCWSSHCYWENACKAFHSAKPLIETNSFSSDFITPSVYLVNSQTFAPSLSLSKGTLLLQENRDAPLLRIRLPRGVPSRPSSHGGCIWGGVIWRGGEWWRKRRWCPVTRFVVKTHVSPVAVKAVFFLSAWLIMTDMPCAEQFPFGDWITILFSWHKAVPGRLGQSMNK